MKSVIDLITGSGEISTLISLKRLSVTFEMLQQKLLYLLTAQSHRFKIRVQPAVFWIEHMRSRVAFPGKYSTIGLNRMALINNRWQRNGAPSTRFVFRSGTNGRSSVSSLNSFNPTNYLRNFLHAQTPANISFSIWAYHCSAVISEDAPRRESDWLEDSISRLHQHSTDSVTACIRTHYRRFR